MMIVKAYVATAVIFGVLDALWLGVIAKGFFQRQLSGRMRDPIAPLPALGFYLIYISGVTVFAVLPGIAAHSWMQAGLLGGFLGLVAYATYELTNLATLKDWPVKMAVVDMAVGVVLSAIAAAGAAVIAASLGG